MTTRLLVIRFSSFGDIVQATPVPAAFKREFPGAEVEWLVRDDFATLLRHHPSIDRVHAFDRKLGLGGLLRLAWRLGAESFTHVYDAHNNVRSHLFMAAFRLRRLFAPRLNFARRSKERFARWLLFRFHTNYLPKPYRGSDSFLRPLAKWCRTEQPAGPQFHSPVRLPDSIRAELERLPRPWIALAPSAAWEMKRWPVEHWQALVQKLEASFIFLGGPEDTFIKDIRAARAVNLAGRVSLAESAAAVGMADLVISNDTGILHVADMMERPALALIGPTAFGYPSRPTSRVLEIELACKPCSKDGRGGCSNTLYKRCLVEITPDTVARAAREALEGRKT